MSPGSPIRRNSREVWLFEFSPVARFALGARRAVEGETMEVSSKGVARIHISEADAARDFAGLMARVRAGAEVMDSIIRTG